MLPLSSGIPNTGEKERRREREGGREEGREGEGGGREKER